MRDLIAFCRLVVGGERCSAAGVVRQAFAEGSVDGLKAGAVAGSGGHAERTRRVIAGASRDDWDAAYRSADDEMAAAASVGARVVTVLDDDYPANLRSTPGVAPFLFYRGDLDAARDAASVSVIGTRRPSGKGISKAERMARHLCEKGIAVVSGLAAGIDSAAHRGAVESGGRTVAVYPTGIAGVYPESNAGLAERILESGGLLISQFFPSDKATKWAFRKRSETAACISQATVVIEADEGSGTHHQAVAARKHGRRLFIAGTLADAQPWAQDMIRSQGALRADHAEDVSSRVATGPPPAQTAAGLEQTLFVDQDRNFGEGNPTP